MRPSLLVPDGTPASSAQTHTAALALRLAAAIGLVVLALGTAAAWHYAAADLALAHYDARAHLVVARRILDSLTPGWQQIGAVWLPLPHLLNMLPVQVDAWYRSGASGIAISVLSMAVGAGALAYTILRVTGSASGAVAGAALLLANPNVLYLQSTPMTEPLLFGTTLLAVAAVTAWLERDPQAPPQAAGLALAAACLTRYEAWPITAALVLLAAAVMVRRGHSVGTAARSACRLASYPVLAVIVFMLNSRWTVGAWFVSGGFFVAENLALGQPLVAWEQVKEGVYQLSGQALVWPAYASAVLIAASFVRTRKHASLVLLLGLAAAGALPWYAYVQGHPLRIRYSVPLVVAASAICAAGIGVLPRRVRAVGAAALLAGVLMQSSPLDRSAPLVRESRREERSRQGRQVVTAYLVNQYDGRTILMSMGSLAHYMHDLARHGFAIHDFLHEGNGELWQYAQLRPRGHVGWIVIEERAEGGDVLFHEAKRNRGFLDGFERVAEGGGVALYRAVR